MGCELVANWGSVPDWVAALSALATFVVALLAYRSWRSQLLGQSQHVAALRIAEAARLLKYHFYDARSPLHEAWEYPTEYHAARDRTPEVEADGLRHLYNGRLKLLWPSIMRIAKLRARASAVLGDDVANQMELLARKARELQFLMSQKVEQERAGPEIVAQWRRPPTFE
jgi:hypothetical protein